VTACSPICRHRRKGKRRRQETSNWQTMMRMMQIRQTRVGLTPTPSHQRCLSSLLVIVDPVVVVVVVVLVVLVVVVAVVGVVVVVFVVVVVGVVDAVVDVGAFVDLGVVGLGNSASVIRQLLWYFTVDTYHPQRALSPVPHCRISSILTSSYHCASPTGERRQSSTREYNGSGAAGQGSQQGQRGG
jgi:hypothetical protein